MKYILLAIPLLLIGCSESEPQNHEAFIPEVKTQLVEPNYSSTDYTKKNFIDDYTILEVTQPLVHEELLSQINQVLDYKPIPKDTLKYIVSTLGTNNTYKKIYKPCVNDGLVFGNLISPNPSPKYQLIKSPYLDKCINTKLAEPIEIYDYTDLKGSYIYKSYANEVPVRKTIDQLKAKGSLTYGDLLKIHLELVDVSMQKDEQMSKQLLAEL
jgi:hypothetical protein